MSSAAIPAARSKKSILRAFAFGVHLYTALGAALGLLAIQFAAGGDFRASFIAMAVAIVIDSSDGTLARLVNVKSRAPEIDGPLLDNIVDYLTYVVAPAFLALRAGIVASGWPGLAVACIVMIASAYQFSQTNAKTHDNFFLGFPSYWNLVVFYLYCLHLDTTANSLILLGFAVMVFIPIKYIYPSRTRALRPLTVALGILWAGITIAMLPVLPVVNPILLTLSLSYVAYYFVVSFALHAMSLSARSRRERM